MKEVTNRHPRERTCILVVDDNRDLRGYICAALTRQGFEVFEAEDGIEGLSEVERRRPDLILADFLMPKMSGLDLSIEVRKDPKFQTTPIVVLTSKIPENAREKALAAGANECLTKPFNEAELLAVVRSLAPSLKVSAKESP